MTRRKRRAARAPVCRDCRAPIVFFGSPFATGLRPFNPKPVDPRNVPGAFPVFGRRAYRWDDVVELLQVQRECARPDAEAEARDLPWHTLHACTDRPAREDPT